MFDRQFVLSHLNAPTPASNAAVAVLLAAPVEAVPHVSQLLAAVGSDWSNDDAKLVFFALLVYKLLSKPTSVITCFPSNFNFYFSVKSLSSPRFFPLLSVEDQLHAKSRLWSLLANPALPTFVAEKLYSVLSKQAKLLYASRQWNMFDALSQLNLPTRFRITKAYLELYPFQHQEPDVRLELLKCTRECLAVLKSPVNGGATTADSIFAVAAHLLPALGSSPSRLTPTSASNNLYSAVSSPVSPSSGISWSLDESHEHVYVLAIQILVLTLSSSSSASSLQISPSSSSSSTPGILPSHTATSVHDINSLLLSALALLRVYTGSCPALNISVEACNALGEFCDSRKQLVGVDFVVGFLGHVGGGLVDSLRRCIQSNSDEDQYTLKLTHLALSFVKNHMKRVESIHQQQQQQQHQQQLFPLDEFLQLLFKFTFNQPNPDRFLDCLQIWDAFVEYLNARNLEGATADVERYREGLVSLAQQIIRVLLWSEEPKYLRELGFEIGSSQSNVAQAAVAEHSMESDGDLFLNSGLALISKISDLYPIDIIQHVASLFLSYSAQLQQQLLQQQSNTGGSNATNGLAFKYKDLLVLSRLVGQLAHFFVELGNFEENLKSTSSLVEAVLELLNLVLAQTSKVHSSTSSIRKDCDLDETRKYLCCGLYSCLRVYIHWFQKYQVHAYENQHNSTLHQSQFSNLLNTLLHTSVSTIIDQASNSVMMSPLSQQSIRPTTTRHSPNVALSASRLLVSVATVVRPGLVGFPGMRPLWSDIHGIARTLGSSCNAGGRECKFNLYKVATLAIVVPTAASKVSEEEWNIRFGQLSEFYAPLLSQFHALWNDQGEFLVNPLDMDGRNQTKHLLESFVGCMEAVSNEPMNPKNIVYMVVKSVVSKALGLYEVCSQDFDMLLALFDFTLALQVSLRRQSARENGMLVIQTLQTFMKLVESRGLLQAAASPVETIGAATASAGGVTIGVEAAASSFYAATGTTARSKKVELLGKFLEFLTAVVQDTSKSIEGLLDHVVAFCQHSFSFIGHEDSSSESLKLHFYNLLFILLTFHQRHFFGSSVSRAASLHEREVASVLEMIAKSFSDRNMEVFRHNLNGLESLNSKCALYQKEFFQKHMMTPFIDLFLGILVSKEHDFMKEEIAGALGKIMTCNVALFIHGYVPHFMGKYCSGIHSQDQARLYNCVTSIQDNSNVVEVIYTLVTELIYIQQKRLLA